MTSSAREPCSDQANAHRSAPPRAQAESGTNLSHRMNRASTWRRIPLSDATAGGKDLSARGRADAPFDRAAGSDPQGAKGDISKDAPGAGDIQLAGAAYACALPTL